MIPNPPINPGPITCAEAISVYQGTLDHPVLVSLLFLLAAIGSYAVLKEFVKTLWFIGRNLSLLWRRGKTP